MLGFSAFAAGCAHLDHQKNTWRAVKTPETPDQCRLVSPPQLLSTVAGSDHLVMIIESNDRISLEISPQNIRLATPEALSVYVDQSPPITASSISADKNKLIFNEEKSKKLLELLSEGKFVYFKLHSPTINMRKNPSISLSSFRKALTDARLCNAFGKKE